MERIAIEDICRHNKEFVSKGLAAPYHASSLSAKHLAIVTCMDARLITMLPAALGLVNGDANVIRVAGALVNESYGAVMRSLLIGVYKLGVRDIMVIAHTDCGAQKVSGTDMAELMDEAGIDRRSIEHTKNEGVDLDQWMAGFPNLEASVRESVTIIENHPLMPGNVHAHGFIIDTETGALTRID